MLLVSFLKALHKGSRDSSSIRFFCFGVEENRWARKGELGTIPKGSGV